MTNGKGYLETVLDIFLKNLMIVVPNVIIVGITSLIAFVLYILGYFSIFGFATFISKLRDLSNPIEDIQKITSLSSLAVASVTLIFLVVIAVIGLLLIAAYALAKGMMADMSLDAVTKGYTNLGKSFEAAKNRFLSLVALDILNFLIIAAPFIPGVALLLLCPPLGIILLLIAILAAAVLSMLFLASPIFVMMGFGAVDSLKESANALIKSLSVRIEVVVGIIVAFLISWLVGVVSILALPFIYILLAYYVVHDLKKLPPPSPESGVLI